MIPQIDKQRTPEHLGQLVQLLLQGGLLILIRLEHLGDQPDLGVHPRAGDQSFAPAVGHQGAHEGRVLPVAEGDFLVQDDIGLLIHRDRFPGQRSLLDFQVDALDQTHVRGDIISCFDQDDVARRPVPGREWSSDGRRG